MNKLKLACLLLLSGLGLSCAAFDHDGRIGYCGGNHRLRVVDLDMAPDPIAEKERVKRWFVRLRADGTGECRTVIRIRDNDGEEVGREVAYRLRPGMNEISVEPSERYRLSRGEHCFEVVADIDRTPRRVDAERRFCAREIGKRRWSMRS
ncbi:MAG TPA: hypothetical protein VNO43_02165 [Candidatus Eisenbacteria bacterium]|nr:hypothetical protein [Candidatus Eisenbacteria bacterium]